MYHLKRLFLPILLMLIMLNGGTPSHAQEIGTTTLVSTAASNMSDGNSSHITPDGRYIIFITRRAYVYVYDRQDNSTHLVSINSLGESAGEYTFNPFDGLYIREVAISDDGNSIAFVSHATNLIPNDTNGMADVFVHDRQTGETSRVSVNSAGIEADSDSTQVELSGDGRYVSFVSHATNLVENDTNGVSDIFVHDRQTGQTSRVSVDADGNQAMDSSTDSDISGDGRYITFTSIAPNLVADDTNGVSDVFVHDRQTGQTIRVSVDADGNEGNGLSLLSTISGDGRYTVFISEATNLIADDTNESGDIFVYDLQTATTTRVSVSENGGELTSRAETLHSNIPHQTPFISHNGNYVVYSSASPDIVSGDSNESVDVFVYNRQTGQTFLASRKADGTLIPNDYGTYFNGFAVSDEGLVTFSTDKIVVPNDSNYTRNMDVFVYDNATNTSTSLTVGNPNILTGNSSASSSDAKLSGDGRYTVFLSTATNLLPDTEWMRGCYVYVHDHQTQSITIASVVADLGGITAINEATAGCNTGMADISDDGRYIAFTVIGRFPSDTGYQSSSGIFLRDMVLNTTILLPAPMRSIDLSGNGRTISFFSDDSSLVPNDTNNLDDIFVYDIETDTYDRVSVDSMGNQANGISRASRISADGRFVLFTSEATNLVENDTNGVVDLFLHDRQTAQTVAVSVDSAGYMGNNTTDLGNMSDDGRYIVFSSDATNLVPNDTNGVKDVFLHDRQTGETSRISVDSFGVQGNQASRTPNISNDGTLILFISDSTNLVAGDANNSGGIFVHNRVNGQTIQVFRHHGYTNIQAQSLSNNGDVFVFTSDANHIVPDDINRMRDVFRRELIPTP